MSVLLNLFFAWLLWKIATAHFEEGNNGIGWVGIGLSALNFATAMAEIF